MKITFENVLDQVVNSRTISRKEKQNAIREFIKENKPASEEETLIIDKLKDIKKAYSLKDASEKTKVVSE
jgi:hypothetical protein